MFRDNGWQGVCDLLKNGVVFHGHACGLGCAFVGDRGSGFGSGLDVVGQGRGGRICGREEAQGRESHVVWNFLDKEAIECVARGEQGESTGVVSETVMATWRGRGGLMRSFADSGPR